MNGNFELFNISRASFLRYLDLCNMQTVAVVGFKDPSLNYDGINYQNVPQHSIFGAAMIVFSVGVARQCSNLC